MAYFRLVGALVSVVVPLFNQAAFLPRALRSLLDQEEQNWEAIIVDDGSTDAAAEAVEPYSSDKRFRYLRLSENRGIGAAVNAGLDLVP